LASDKALSDREEEYFLNDPSDSLVFAHDGIVAASTVTDALQAFQTAYGLDFATYHLAATVVGKIDNPFVRTTYPDAWVARYLLNGYVDVDPVVQEGFQRQLPFDWRELDPLEKAQAFLDDARQFGLGEHGYSIPIADKCRRRALLSVNSCGSTVAWERMQGRCRDEWIELAHLIHSKAVVEIHGEDDPAPQLSPREQECLHWAALGKDYKDVAVILAISEHTARSYLKSARVKLGCATISAATTKALKYHLISV
jgi:DNA-binding CsgD family transcriptional regulator